MASDNILTSFLTALQKSVLPTLQNYSAQSGGDSALSMLQGLQNGQAPITSLSQLTQQTSQPSAAEQLVWLGQRQQFNARASMNSLDPTTLAQNSARERVAVPISQATNLPFTWSEKERDKAYARASAAIGTKITSFSQFLDVWNKASNIAAQSWAATQGGKNGSPLTVWDVFDLSAREGAKYGYGSSASQAKTVTQTSRTINQLSDGGAWAIIKSAAREALGRNPTHDEVRQFAARANDIAVNNPSTSKTVTHYNADGTNTSSSTKSKQGAGIDDFQEEAEKRVDTAEAGAYQASTTYYNAMLQGLNSVV